MAQAQSDKMFASIGSPEEQELERRQAILQALQMQALSPMQGPAPGQSGPFQVAARTNPLEGVAKLLQGYVANKGMTRLGKEQTALQGGQRQEFAAGLQQINDAVGDQRKQLLYEALESRNPYLRQRALEMVGEKPDLMEVTPGNPLVDKNTGQFFEPSGNASGKAAYETVEINGDLYQKTATGLKKLDNAPRISNTTNVNMPQGETMFEKYFGIAEGKRLSEDLATVDSGIEGAAAVKKGKELLEKGIYTGFYAKLGMNAEKIAAPFVDKDPVKAARTEEFISYIGNIVVPRLKDFGGSDTVEEMKYLQQITAGDVTMEEGTLRNVLDSVEIKLQKKMQRLDNSVKSLQKRGVNLPSMEALPNLNPEKMEEMEDIEVIWE